MRKLVVALLIGVSVSVSAAHSAPQDDKDEALWYALKRGNHVILLRHTETVAGIGDPPGYRLDDCRTQRNLNDAGRAQARGWANAVTEKAIPIGGVFSSVWCRCVETATLAFGQTGRAPDTWPALNSHFDSATSAALQAEQVRGGIPARMQVGKNLVLVTHQVNITALTGAIPAMGEAVIARVRTSGDKRQLATLEVIGSLKLP